MVSKFSFNVVAELSVTEKSGAVYNESVVIIAHAHDVDKIERSPKMRNEACLHFERTEQKIGLVINEEKNKYMKVTTRRTNTQFLA
jgi:hypothetical protein